MNAASLLLTVVAGIVAVFALVVLERGARAAKRDGEPAFVGVFRLSQAVILSVIVVAALTAATGQGLLNIKLGSPTLASSTMRKPDAPLPPPSGERAPAIRHDSTIEADLERRERQDWRQSR